MHVADVASQRPTRNAWPLMRLRLLAAARSLGSASLRSRGSFHVRAARVKRQDTAYRCPTCGQTVRLWGVVKHQPTCGHFGTGIARKPADMELVEETGETT